MNFIHQPLLQLCSYMSKHQSSSIVSERGGLNKLLILIIFREGDLNWTITNTWKYSYLFWYWEDPLFWFLLVVFFVVVVVCFFFPSSLSCLFSILIERQTVFITCLFTTWEENESWKGVLAHSLKGVRRKIPIQKRRERCWVLNRSDSKN